MHRAKKNAISSFTQLATGSQKEMYFKKEAQEYSYSGNHRRCTTDSEYSNLIVLCMFLLFY
jgi:hypothetical protein